MGAYDIMPHAFGNIYVCDVRTKKSRGEDRMNIKLHYTERGSGAPLVLLHGNGEDGTFFSHQLEYFSEQRRVIAVDTRGHGRSPRGDARFTIRQFAEDLKAFFDEHKIEKADILGFSDGGNIALIFALRYPECVDRLILNGANLYGRGVKAKVQLPIVIAYKLASLSAKRSERAKTNAEILGLMVNDPNIEPQELSRLNMPVLVITGTKDMIRDSHTKLIADSIKGSRRVQIPGDHFVANKNPQEFNRAIERFLNEAL